MIKWSMKLYKDSQPSRLKLLDSWQYALKLIANVTYGYTAAGNTGWMPCCEIADAIVGIAWTHLEQL